MLYTKKGDNGTTRLFDSKGSQRISKSSLIFEVLGTLDELNSTFGYIKALSRKSNNSVVIKFKRNSYEEIVDNLQQGLFCIQAEIGGADVHLPKEKITYLEEIIYEIETLLPPIQSFIIPGGGETGAYLDLSRAIARRTERQLVSLRDRGERIIDDNSIIFLNRISSVLYAMARFANYQDGYVEKKPQYL